MRFLKYITAGFLLLFISCSGAKVKVAPIYNGVDPEFVKVVDLYIELAAQRNIYFNREVTMGFTKLERGKVIGTCTYGGYFREIDIDGEYWETATQTTRLTLLFHELTHCYCGRDHDWAKGRKYKEDVISKLLDKIDGALKRKKGRGFWEDECPKSVMYPVVLDDQCMYAHYQEYIQEMFDRCQKW